MQRFFKPTLAARQWPFAPIRLSLMRIHSQPRRSMPFSPVTGRCCHRRSSRNVPRETWSRRRALIGRKCPWTDVGPDRL